MNAEDCKAIYNLKLHEHHIIKEGIVFSVLRVPGGWVYTFDMDKSIFVPYNEEFKNK